MQAFFRRLVIFSGVFLLFLSLIFSSSQPQRAAAAEDMVTLDKQRTILFNFSHCVVRYGGRDESIIDTHHGHFGDGNALDSIGDWMDDNNYHVGIHLDPLEANSGSDRNAGNGTWSCLDILIAGINVLIDRGALPSEPYNINESAKLPEIKSKTDYTTQKQELNKWFTKYVTTKMWGELDGGTVPVSQDVFESKLRELQQLSNTELGEIQINQIAKQSRYIVMFNICYDSYSISNGDISNFPGGFKYPEANPTGYYYLRGRDDMKNEILKIVHDGGDDNLSGDKHNYRLDDHQLPFYTFKSGRFDGDLGGGRFESKITNWYPLGGDLAPFNNSGPNEGVAECGMFQDDTAVRDLMLSDNVEIDDSTHKLVFKEGIGDGFETGLPDDLAPSQDNCDAAADFAFSFVLCPILALMDTAIGWLDDQIVSAMSIDNSYYETNEVKQAWGNIRNIAYVLLIPAMLIMVIGTALQFSFLDPYTVKRALPRMFVGIIFIALSYEICTIFIEIVDGVGRGIGGLVASPFGGFDNLTLQRIFEPPDAGGGTGQAIINGSILLAGVGVAFFSGVTIWSLFVFFGVAALALLIIFLLLSVREMMVIFLVVVSPLAIIAWIFPGNDKPWKLWYSTFTKMLYLFPVIMAILAVGRGFASIVNVAGDGGISTIVKLVAFIGPYFFIPKAFQMAGGALGSLAGMVNDRSKGVFDRARKSRQDSMKHKRERIKSGNAFKGAPPDSWRARMNQRAMSAAHIKSIGAKGLVSRSERMARIQGAKDQTELNEWKHLDEDFGLQKMLANDDFSQAVMQGKGDYKAMLDYLMSEKGGGYSEQAARGTAAALEAKTKQYGRSSMMSAAVIAKAGSKTSYTAGQGEMMADVALAAEGNSGVAHALMFTAKGRAAQAGRLDLSDGSGGEASAELETILGADNATQRAALAEETNIRMAQKVLEGKSAYALAQMHPTAGKNLVKGLARNAQQAAQKYNVAQMQYDRNPNAQNQANLVEAQRALGHVGAQINNLRQSASYMGPELARVFDDSMNSQPVTLQVQGPNGGPAYASMNLHELTDHVARLAGPAGEAYQRTTTDMSRMTEAQREQLKQQGGA